MASDSTGINYAGIDTHKDTHVVAVIDSIGRLIAHGGVSHHDEGIQRAA